MTAVYRVEKNGAGPYARDWPRRRDLGYAHGDDPRRPSPGKSFDGVRPGDAYVYGFSNMKSLLGWFGSWLPIILSYGFKVVKYENVTVGYVCQHDYQVAFIPPKKNH